MISDKIKEIVMQRKKYIKNDLDYMKSIAGKTIRDNRKPLSRVIKENPEVSIISEIKPASPTLGEIRSNFNVSKLVVEMESAGVIGISVLTEPNYFNGSYENLKIAVKNTKLPCLMKDFIVDTVQIMIASQIGATNILIINSICNEIDIYEQAIDNGLEPLIEIHDGKEIQDIRNLFEIGLKPKLIGVNNRNLRTLDIDLRTSKEIIPLLKEEFGEKIQVVSESGIKTVDDMNSIKPTGVDAFLIGSSIMLSNNIREKILELRGIK